MTASPCLPLIIILLIPYASLHPPDGGQSSIRGDSAMATKRKWQSRIRSSSVTLCVTIGRFRRLPPGVFVRTAFINRAGRRRENRALGNLTVRLSARRRGGILALIPQNRVPSSEKDRVNHYARSVSAAPRARERDLSADLALSSSRYCDMLAHNARRSLDHCKQQLDDFIK